KPVPRSTPATASESQCAARYARDSPITMANATAAAPHTYLRGPSGNSAITAATTVTDAATAWPDGNDDPLVCTSDPGGRIRSYSDLRVPIEISESTTADTNAATCHHRRRHTRNPAISNRTGSVT